jgi:ubiquinol-cytochrome c reductase core subunit 2
LKLTLGPAHELNEEVIRVMKLGQKGLLASPLHLASNSAHGIAFHRGLGTPLYPTSSTTFSKYLDAEEIYNFSLSAYSKSSIAVVANGTSHSELSKWVGEFFGDTHAQANKLASSPSKYHGGEERIAHDRGNVMILAFPGSSSFTSGSSYRPEISVLAALLGGVSSIKWSPGFSLLSKALQDRQVHASTRDIAYSDAGLLVITLTGDGSQIPEASKRVVETIKQIAAGNVDPEDIKKATAAAKFGALEAGQEINAGLEATGTGLISGGKAHQIDEVARAIEKVGKDQVKAVRGQLDQIAEQGTDGFRLRIRCLRRKLRSLLLAICLYCHTQRRLVSRSRVGRHFHCRICIYSVRVRQHSDTSPIKPSQSAMLKNISINP